MAQYFKSVWAMLSPSRPESMPLLPVKPDDLEACVYGSAATSDSIVLVCESPEAPEAREAPEAQEAPAPHRPHVRVSPFSEDHFPPWPLLSSDA
jgi:hypothetical protein